MLTTNFDPFNVDIAIGDELEARAYSMLCRHPHFRGRADMFQYECCGNRLIVRGAVPTFYLKQLVQALLMQLDDSLQIDNQVAVTDYVPIRGGYPYIAI